MKRLFNFLFVALMAIMVLSCSTDTPNTPNNPSTPDNPDTGGEVVDNSIKILAIGNSFSVDAMEYLYQILADLGYEDITLGNLYVAGCSLERHAYNLDSSRAEYTYYRNTTGEWNSTSSQTPFVALRAGDWDYITLQQASPSSGLANTYDPYLDKIIDYVQEYCPQSKIVWHMTWAYQSDSTHSGFASYSSDQMTMYNAILDAVNKKVLTKPEISSVIPSGTAVQNMRTSYVGDILTRDGYHMSYDKGRLLTAMTYAKALTGRDLSLVNYTPEKYTYTPALIMAMKEAVNNAVASPYEVTPSTFTTNPDNIVTDTLDEVVKANGYDVNDFNKVEIVWHKYAYYQSDKSNDKYGPSDLKDAGYYSASTANRYIATQIFSKSDIPNGSLIVLKGEYQYRPEGWVTLDTQNYSENRPGNTNTKFVVVNNSWWGNWNYRGFNITGYPSTSLSEEGVAEAMASFGIYTPKN